MNWKFLFIWMELVWVSKSGMLFWFICYNSSDLFNSKGNCWLSKYTSWTVAPWSYSLWEHMGLYTPAKWVWDVWLSEARVTKVFFASFLLTNLPLGSITRSLLSFHSWFLQILLWLFSLFWVLWFLETVYSIQSNVYLQFLWISTSNFHNRIFRYCLGCVVYGHR